jgi:diguanylate cyclase (GGDEF)-like protein
MMKLNQSNLRAVTYQKLTTRILLTLVILVIAQFLTMISLTTNTYVILWFGLFVFVTCAGYLKSRVFGLICGLIAIFLSGSLSIYQYVILHLVGSPSLSSGLWFLLFPAGGFLGGMVGELARSMASKVDALTEQYELIADPVTGLVNKSRFLLEIQSELARCRRKFYSRSEREALPGDWGSTLLDNLDSEEQMTVMIISINYHNELMAIYGERALEQVYIGIAQAMETSSRFTDSKSRLGVSEFGLILLETSKQGAEFVKNRMFELAAKLEINPDGKRTRTISVKLSFGTASAPMDGVTAEELFASARRELTHGRI